MRWYVERLDYGLRTNFYLAEPESGTYAKPLEIVVERREDQIRADGPTLQLQVEHAESLFQAMWDAGFRPPEERVSDQTLEAQKAHIALAEKVIDGLMK